jgi:7-carboxy-7-deazaguanine synthase
MVVNEIFYSLQGEGSLIGVPSVFIRLAGCPIKCRWCDTSYAFSYEDGENLTIEQIAEKVGKYNCDHFVITGGEPLVNPDLTPRPGLKELLGFMKQQGRHTGHTTIETSGIIFVPELDCDLMSISPKLPNSGTDKTYDLGVIQQLLIEYQCQFKFVVEGANDIREVEKIIGSLAGVQRDKVMLMPQAKNRDEYLKRAPEIAELCLKHDFTFSQRLHVLLWDKERGR